MEEQAKRTDGQIQEDPTNAGWKADKRVPLREARGVRGRQPICQRTYQQTRLALTRTL